MTAGEGVVRESTCNGSGVTDLGHQSSASMSSRSLAPRRAGTHSLLSEQINYLTNPNHKLTLNPGTFSGECFNHSAGAPPYTQFIGRSSLNSPPPQSLNHIRSCWRLQGRNYVTVLVSWLHAVYFTVVKGDKIIWLFSQVSEVTMRWIWLRKTQESSWTSSDSTAFKNWKRSSSIERPFRNPFF